MYLILSAALVESNKSLTYSTVRSIFSTEERIDQLFATIDSIKKHDPNPEIVYLEIGGLDVKKNYSLPINVNYVYLGGNWLVKKSVQSRWKGLGEIVGLIVFLIAKDVHYKKKIIKISGRYKLNSYYNYKNWNIKNKFSFLYSNGTYSTRLYSIPSNLKFIYFVILILSIFPILLNISLEKIFFILFPKFLVNVNDFIGITGLIGVDAIEINE